MQELLLYRKPMNRSSLIEMIYELEDRLVSLGTESIHIPSFFLCRRYQTEYTFVILPEMIIVIKISESAPIAVGHDIHQREIMIFQLSVP